MKINMDIDNTYGLPRKFLKFIEPYISPANRKPDTATQVIGIWEEGIKHIRLHPVLRENIAAWTMSATSASPLVKDNDIFEAIYLEIGALEVLPTQSTGKESLEEALAKIEAHIEEARRLSQR